MNFSRNIDNPIWQGVLTLGGAYSGGVLVWCLQKMGWIEATSLYPIWILMLSLVLVFILFNSIIGLNASQPNVYLAQSSSALMVLYVLIGGLGWILTGISLLNDTSLHRLVMVLTIGFLVFSSIVGLIRFVIHWSKANDEKHH